jgi:PTH1 family peptidyl-tRNA hydrolase
MFLIAGLGNTGAKYLLNRHNIGFLALDYALSSTNIVWKNKFNSLYFKENSLIFIKPQTYMNNSGLALTQIKKFYKLKNNQIIIISDDLDLGFGAIKIKTNGSVGGHNGLASIKNTIGDNFINIKIGISSSNKTNKDGSKNTINYVLGDFSKLELESLNNNVFGIIKDIIFNLENKSIENISSIYSQKALPNLVECKNK